MNAAGITGPTGPFHELTDEDWLEALQSDLMAAARVCRAFIPAMAKAGSGRVVLFGSEDAQQPCSTHASFITGANLRVDGGSVATV